MAAKKSWRELRAERPLNEKRVAVYRRLMDAEAALLPRIDERGGDSPMGAALAAIEAEDPAGAIHPDLYLATLRAFVALLGGHVEVRAVFADDTVTLFSDASGED